jgi:hypothetical protein
MIDVHVPTTDGRALVLTRYTKSEPVLRLLLDRPGSLRRPSRPQ